MQNRWIVLGAVVALTAPIAWANLGQDKPAPISTDASSARPATAARVVARSMPSDVKIRSVAGPQGIPVQEYIGADGSLFAITWAGPQRVDAQGVVAHFFPQVDTEGNLASRGVHAVVRSSRQPWGNVGVAYVPSLMPMDFDPNGLAP
jgi:hypothetical protein